ncbi:hypothetical protein [Acidipropionibacterium jensenii]|uniref:hypothetical protein n=1 Tax=Acidipropionibacterium jensenii TaxID=1749 RepID=UPI00214B8CD6|nr:hypothetical protein [Acidipropionibacterium jensenii]
MAESQVNNCSEPADPDVAELEVQNGLLLVLDPGVGLLPETLSERPVTATASCIAVGTLHGAEGSTNVRMAEEAAPSDDELHLRWAGEIHTEQSLCVMTVELERILSVPCRGAVQVSIYSNDSEEPDSIWIEWQKSAP